MFVAISRVLIHREYPCLPQINKARSLTCGWTQILKHGKVLIFSAKPTMMRVIELRWVRSGGKGGGLPPSTASLRYTHQLRPL